MMTQALKRLVLSTLSKGSFAAGSGRSPIMLRILLQMTPDLPRWTKWLAVLVGGYTVFQRFRWLWIKYRGFQVATIPPEYAPNVPLPKSYESYDVNSTRFTVGLRAKLAYSAKLNDFHVTIGFAPRPEQMDEDPSIIRIMTVYDIVQHRHPNGEIILSPESAGHEVVGNRWKGFYTSRAGHHIGVGESIWLAVEIEADQSWEGYLYFKGSDSQGNHCSKISQNMFRVLLQK